MEKSSNARYYPRNQQINYVCPNNINSFNFMKKSISIIVIEKLIGISDLAPRAALTHRQ